MPTWSAASASTGERRPLFGSCIQRFERGGRVVLVNPGVPSWVVVNAAGEALLRLFDGRHTIEEVVAAACGVLGAGRRAEVEDVCRRAVEIGLFDEGAPITSRQCHQSAPGIVHLSLTDECNLRCRYCYARARTERQQPLTLDEWKAVVDSIVGAAGGRLVEFNLTGGEPLLNADWLPLTEHIRSCGATVLLLTNATLVTASNAGDIARLMERVTVSVDGPDAATHAQSRGDNFDRVMRGVDLLDGAGAQVVLSMTVTRQNIGQVASASRRFGRRLHYAPYFPVLADPEAVRMAITGDEYYEALRSAHGVEPLGHCAEALEGARRNPCHKCALGDNEIALSPSGDVYPCQLLHVSELLAGNVRERDVMDIYRTSPVLARCAALDADTMPGCRDCAVRRICGGSCRARVYYEAGRLEGDAPFCRYELRAYIDGIAEIYGRD